MFLSQLKLIALSLITLSLISCQTTRPSTTELTIFAAASLTDAFTALAEAFEAEHEDVTLIYNFAGSSQLAAQLREGARADIFASANAPQMEAVITAERITSGSSTPFVSNQLTIITPADNPAAITSLDDLVQKEITLISAAIGVPVRTYTDQLIATKPTPFQAAFYANLLSEEDNVRQIVAKVMLGEADAAIVYTSDITPTIASQVTQIPIPMPHNINAVYLIAPLADASHPQLAQAFIQFIHTPAGQAILASKGFTPPPSGS